MRHPTNRGERLVLNAKQRRHDPKPKPKAPLFDTWRERREQMSELDAWTFRQSGRYVQDQQPQE